MTTPTPAVYIGLDVGKSDHHAVALTTAGERVYDKALPNDETRLRAILDDLAAAHGPVLLVVDQPATIGALPVAVAQSCEDVEVAYLPGLAMRRIADLHPGSAKTDARDAAIIAEAARTMPHTLRAIRVDDEQIAELAMLAGADDDLAAQITASSNRLRGLLTQIHPALERVLGPRITHPAVADLLGRYPTPGKLKTAGPGHVRARLRKHAPRLANTLTEEIFEALAQQTVVVAGTEAAATVVPILAEQLAGLLQQRARLATQVEAVVEAHPQHLRPDLDARYRGQDRSTDSHRSRGQGLRRCRAPGLLRRHRPRHPPLRDLDPRRARTPRRQQAPEARPVPLGLRLTAPRPLEGLLRPKTSPGQAPQPSADRPGAAAH